MRPARRRTAGNRAPRRSSRPPAPAWCRRNPRTSARRRHAFAAWSATGALPRRGKARNTGCNRIRRDVRPDAPPTTAQASRPAGAVRDESPPSRAVLGDPSLRPTAAGTKAAPAPRRSDSRAAANSGPPAAHAERSRLPPSHRSIGWPRSSVWTCRRHVAATRRVSCAWVISVQPSPLPLKGYLAMPILRPPNGAVYTRPQPGRDRPEWVVAINRNQWSQSIGISGRNQPVRADSTTLRDTLRKIEAQYGKANRIWVMDRGIPSEEVLAEMRAADPPVSYLVGTPKGRLSKLEKHLVTLPWQAVREGVDVKLLPH